MIRIQYFTEVKMLQHRRYVDLIMDKPTYKKLGKQPDSEKAWKLVRSIVGENLFGREFVAVPQIDSARYYSQLFVFKKQFDASTALRLFPPKYRINNHLDNLLNVESSAWIPQFDFSKWSSAKDNVLPIYFHLVIHSSGKESLRKTIEVVIKESRIRSVSLPVPVSSTVLTVLSLRGQMLNVITSVVLANYVRIRVRIGDQESLLVSRINCPVGFKYKKYKILPNGQFHQEQPTTLKLTDSEARWVRPKAFPLFRSLWDPMRRRNDGSRPSRSFLTISSGFPEVDRLVP